MRTFVFGIGGTGSRVIRSLTMLLASGVRLNNDENPDEEHTIIPIVIDIDSKNRDTARTIDALNSYRSIRENLYDALDTSANMPPFFKTKLIHLSDVRTKNSDIALSESFQFGFEDYDKSFADYIDLHGLRGKPEDALLRLLYDDSSSNSSTAELNLNLAEGFKGNPNIGSVVFNSLSSEKEFKFFENEFQDKDRIFIVSSIFGGTGSSGFPQLLSIFRNSSNNNVKNAKIGAISVMPYFKVESVTNNGQENRTIDSMRFVSKTKAALSFYEKELPQLDKLYYICDLDSEKQYPYAEGGDKQKNNAHLIELVSALAIVNFVRSPNSSFQQGSELFYEFGLKANKPMMQFGDLHSKTQNYLVEPLTELMFFRKLFNQKVEEQLNTTFSRNLNLNATDFRSDGFYKELRNFLDNHFFAWLEELGDNHRGFSPFSLDDNVHFANLIKGLEVKKGGIFGNRLPEPKIRTAFDAEAKNADLVKNCYARFVLSLHAVSSEFLKTILPSLDRL